MLGRLFRQFIRPYWVSKDWPWAFGLFVLSIGMSYSLVDAMVRINYWITDFYNILQNHDKAAFAGAFVTFAVLVVYAIASFIIYVVASSVLSFRWRRWLTTKMVKDWFLYERFYKIGLLPDTVDNPDQRIAQDVANFTDKTIGIVMALINQLMVAISFCLILWRIAPAFTFHVQQHDITIPGYLLWAALGYDILATLLVYWVGRKLVSLDFIQEQYEADFRYGLMRVREYRENIAMVHGAVIEERNLDFSFQRIMQNFYKRLNYQVKIITLNNLFLNWRTVVSFALASPIYFAGMVNFGQLMQIHYAFLKVEDSFAFFRDQFQEIVQWAAICKRLITFYDHLDTITGRENIPESHSITVRDLVITKPNGGIIVPRINLNIQPGEKVLLKGTNGSGKTSLFRCLSGIWPNWEGHLSRPADMVFVPQRPYYPIATLAEAIVYPEPLPTQPQALAHVMQQIHDYLGRFDLSKLTPQLDHSADWNKILSLGELQKLQIIRILIQAPAWICLDEPTSAMDHAGRRLALSLLLEELKSSTIVMITHGVEEAAGWDKSYDMHALTAEN